MAPKRKYESVEFESRRGWRLRIVQIALWIGAALAAWFATLSLLEASAESLLLISVAVLTALAAGGFEMFMRRYVIAIVGDGAEVEITTLTTSGQRAIRAPRAALSAVSGIYESDIDAGYASWRLVRLAGRPFPFILDTTAQDISAR